MALTLRLAVDMPEELRPLFVQYGDYLIARDERMRDCLGEQNYDDELLHLREKYAGGGIYLAQLDGETVGCVALRRMDAVACEMKRVFLVDTCRGRGCGRTLVQLALAEAKRLGFQYVRLDTVAYLEAAVAIYQELGFTPAARFNNNPLPYAIYFEKKL